MDEDIIHVDCDISFIDQFVEKMIHHQLEGGWGIGESKKHHHWFEEASVHLKRGLPLISITNSDIVVAPSDVKLRKEGQSATMHSHKLIYEFVYEGEWGSVLDGEGI